MEIYKTEELKYFTIYQYESFYARYVKRILDFSMALLFILLLHPLFFIIGICIIASSGLPVFYCAPRGGCRGKPFKICKFRTMIADADKIGGGTTALNDSRITKIGAVLRKTKLDEIPQLWNVLKGDMSFVGPRPELLQYTSRYQGKEKCILSVRPGITDYSSIEFIDLDQIVGEADADANYEKYVLGRKNELRMKYVMDISLRTDIKLFFCTVFHIMGKLLKSEHSVQKQKECPVRRKI